MNRGIVEGNAENSNSVDLSVLNYLRNIQKSRADFFRTRLVDYLVIGKGQNKFPKYVSQTSQDGMKPDKKGYNSPIYFTDITRKGYNKRIINRSMDSYSEDMNSNPPCNDCY
jgi:hypothetical protein